MLGTRAWHRSWCVVGLAAVGGIAGAAQPASSLRLLTVPVANLPSGCGLKAPDPAPAPIPPTESSNAAGTTVVVTSRRPAVRFPYPFPSNPWFGTDYKFRLMLRRTIDSAGPLRVPDAPPMSNREFGALVSTWADNVEEAYQATYLAADGRLVVVSAVRFDDTKWAAADPSRGPLGASRGAPLRVVHGATAILISGPHDNACFDAVSRHVQSLRGLK